MLARKWLNDRVYLGLFLTMPRRWSINLIMWICQLVSWQPNGDDRPKKKVVTKESNKVTLNQCWVFRFSQLPLTKLLLHLQLGRRKIAYGNNVIITNHEYHNPFLPIDAPIPSVKLVITFREKDLLPLESLLSHWWRWFVANSASTGAAQLLLWDNNSSHCLDADYLDTLSWCRLASVTHHAAPPCAPAPAWAAAAAPSSWPAPGCSPSWGCAASWPEPPAGPAPGTPPSSRPSAPWHCRSHYLHRCTTGGH